MEPEVKVEEILASIVQSLIIVSAHYLTHKEVAEAVQSLSPAEVLEAAGATEAGITVFVTALIVTTTYNTYGWRYIKD
jgi:hypothetical protein